MNEIYEKGTHIGLFLEMKYILRELDMMSQDYICNIKEIIGHYDITAVLKCIGKQKILGHYDYDEGYFEFFNDDGTLFCKVKDMPLHLYTEEEEKDLLELLKKLGPTQEK